MYGVTTRNHNSGKNTFILVRYPLSTSRDANGRPYGLMRYAGKPAQHVAGTWASDAYCTSVATAIQRLVEDQILDPTAAVPIIETMPPDATADGGRRRRRLETKRDAALAKANLLREDSEGLELLAARKEKAGDHEAADRYDQRARQSATEAQEHTTAANAYTAELQRLDNEPASGPDPVEANLSLVAYLQAGLHRAGLHNGRSSRTFQAVASKHVVERRFKVRGDSVEWTAVLAIPLISGGELRVPLSGSVQNIRQRAGKEIARADLVAQYVLRDGRELEEIALQQTATRKTVLTKRMMPWLRDHGVKARGAKNGLVDHPLHLVQRIMHDELTGASDGFSARWSNSFVGLLRDVYGDPDLEWGDAACPDDTTWIATVVATVTRDAATRKSGVPVLDLALALDVGESDIRGLVKPQKRAGGFTRPRYLAYADKSKTRVKAIGCPHKSCRGRRHADHVVLLPEVAASGFGVICTRCRRAPSDTDTWSSTQFPTEYLQHWTNRGPDGSLRQQRQTVVAARPTALEAV